MAIQFYREYIAQSSVVNHVFETMSSKLCPQEERRVALLTTSCMIANIGTIFKVAALVSIFSLSFFLAGIFYCVGLTLQVAAAIHIEGFQNHQEDADLEGSVHGPSAPFLPMNVERERVPPRVFLWVNDSAWWPLFWTPAEIKDPGEEGSLVSQIFFCTVDNTIALAKWIHIVV